MKVMEDPAAVEKLRSGVDREKNLDVLRSEYDVSTGLPVIPVGWIG
jgi:translation initiation factor 3 subunit E